MWYITVEREERGRVAKIRFTSSSETLTFSSVLTLLLESPEFADFFGQALLGTQFNAFRWETPPVTAQSVERLFECVVLDRPSLANRTDYSAFAKHFRTGDDGIAVFSSLGNDATLIVPCPTVSDADYGHFAAFLRNAPDAQRHALWGTVARELQGRLSQQPIWLNTAGAGVPWLHVRLDSRPKYYGYAAYRHQNLY